MILVTGATGNIGSEIVRQLAAKGVPVRAMVHNPDKAPLRQAPGVEIVYGDLDRPDTLAPALEGVDKAYLVSNITERQAELQSNFVEAARRAGVRHLVKSSAIGASLDSPVSYLRWHAQTEKQVAESGMDYTFIQPHIFMQQTFEFIPTIQQQGMMFSSFPNGKRLSVVDVRDIAAVAVGTLTGSGHEGATYRVTGPEALSYDDMAGHISEVIGKPVTYVAAPPDVMVGALLQFGIPEWRARDVVTMLELFTDPRYAEVTDAVAKVGNNEPTTFAQFVRDYAAAFSGSEMVVAPS